MVSKIGSLPKYFQPVTRKVAPSMPPIKYQSIHARALSTRRVVPLQKRICRVPEPKFTQRLSDRGFYSRIDLTNLPKPSGYGDKGIQLVTFDSAGTLTGCGVLSPAVVYFDLFKKYDVPITMNEAYEPMGKHKFHHLCAIFELDIEPELGPVKERWKKKYGEYPSDTVKEEMFSHFPKMQLDCLKQYEVPITGAHELLHNVREMGWATASTTGFLTGMDIYLQQVCAASLAIDYPGDAEQAPYGRPRGDMVLLGLARAGVAPSHCIKVGDMQGDDLKGLDANVWTVGLSLTSCYVRKTERELEDTPKEMLNSLHAHAISKHMDAQPHFIAPGPWAVFPILRQIDLLTRKGFHPFDFPVQEVNDPAALFKPARIIEMV